VARILAISDGGSHSGFASVSHNIFERLVADYSHDIHLLASNYRGDYWPTNLKLYLPTQKEAKDVMGMSRYVELMAQIVPDLLIFIQDPKVVLNCLTANPWDRESVLWRGLIAESGLRYKPPILAYLAIDGYNSPSSWDILASRVTRIAMSHHGQQAMPEAPVIWHGVDTDVFKPRDKAESKRLLGFDPDRFLILRVDRNTWRKDYPSSWKALRPVLRAHPDIDVHFHCLPNAKDGYDLNAVRWNDEDIRERITMTQDLQRDAFGAVGVPQDQLATLYSAADLFISTSWGEGFGLTLLEAMASGTPVIASNHSAVTEVVGDGGVLIEPKGRMYVPMGQEQCLPDVDKFTYWIERLYESKSLREKYAAAAVVQASKFSWDTAASMFNDQIVKALATNEAPVEAEAVEV
jgi:glycosyltransferase involved in cell wall biosynthesis